jgi:hypothetical protein
MATLLIKTVGLENQALELRPGVNRVGRSPDSDLLIGHPSISVNHCELILSADGLILRDCGSSSGSFVDGSAVKEAPLRAGQTVTLGDVEVYVQSITPDVTIPQYEHKLSQLPTSSGDGKKLCLRHAREPVYKCSHCAELACGQCVIVLRRAGGLPLFLCPECKHKCDPIIKAATLAGSLVLCPRHPDEPAEYRCTHCFEIMCDECIHILKLKGGTPLFLCPACGHKCEMIQNAPPKKKGFIKFLKDTVKLRFKHPVSSEDSSK